MHTCVQGVAGAGLEPEAVSLKLADEASSGIVGSTPALTDVQSRPEKQDHIVII